MVRADRKTAVFTVDAVKTYTKDKFPDDKVYGETGQPELRLLTCGGRFDGKAGYSANVVVFAHLTSLKKTV
ncbi:putative secreted protein [Streptomyces globisporus]|uniref:Secreted protein n=1 Tax=Streptomyces globisporus TaxID=1908 RepID=A0ABN8VGR7_STRGL|nr:putative secreted protein [Streptomyces globisporus]